MKLVISVKGNAVDPVTLKLINLAINIQSLIPKKNQVQPYHSFVSISLSVIHLTKCVSKFISLLIDNTWLLRLWVVTLKEGFHSSYDY
jgi:hypothetical protein